MKKFIFSLNDTQNHYYIEDTKRGKIKQKISKDHTKEGQNKCTNTTLHKNDSISKNE